MRKRTGGMRGPIAGLAIAVVVVAATGCGEDDGDGAATAAPQSKYSRANEAPENYMRRVAKLLETSRSKTDCLQLETELEVSSVRFSCPPDKQLSQSMAKFELIDAEDYGTGGIVDYKSGTNRDGASIVLIVGTNRKWGISQFGVSTRPSVGTSDEESRDGYASAVDAYLEAIRTRDCQTFREVSFAAMSGPGTSCARSFAEVATLARLLRKNPRAKPVYQGGNSTYGFYSLETRWPRPENRTIAIADRSAMGTAGSIVMGVAPSQTAAEQRDVIREFKKQQREGKPEGGPKTSPSKKAD